MGARANDYYRDEAGTILSSRGTTTRAGERRFERREGGGGIVNWGKDTFGYKGSQPDVPGAPTTQQLYGGPTAFGAYKPEAASIQGDQEGIGAARQSMQNLAGLAQSGWTDTGRGQYEAMLRRGQQASASQRMGAQQQAQARGLSRGGAGLLAGMVGSQADANAAADAAVGMAAQGEQNRMAANQAYGTMGLGINAQTYGQQAQNAAATDAFNQWASGMQANAQQQNFENQMSLYEAQAAKEKEKRRRWAAVISGGATAIADMFGGD